MDVTRLPMGYLDERGWPLTSHHHELTSMDACANRNTTDFDQTLPASDTRPIISSVLATVASEYNRKPFHWLVEALPRVALLLKAAPELKRGCNCPVSTDGSKNNSCCSPRVLVKCHSLLVKESLHLLGILGRRVLCWHPGRKYTTTVALLWPDSSPCGGAKATALRSLRRDAT